MPYRKLFTAAALVAIGVLCAAGMALAVPPEEEDDPPADKQLLSEQLSQIFDQQVFSFQKPQAARKQLELRLKQHLDEIDKLCELTPDQLQKLELAGRADLKRLLEVVASRRREFMNHEAAVLDDIDRRLLELEPLGISSACSEDSFLFRERSLLHKTALTVLPSDQRERYRSEMENRRLTQLLATQAAILKTIDHNLKKSLKKKLDGRQREKLVVLWERLPCAQSGPVDARLFMHLVSRIPKEDYRDILDDLQWAVLQNSFKYTQHYGPALIQLGLIDEHLQENP